MPSTLNGKRNSALFYGPELEETMKWGAPVYTINGKNVVGMAAFKNHYALWFQQGALLKENTTLLHNAQEEKTQVMRQIRLEKGTPLKLKLTSRKRKNLLQKRKTSLNHIQCHRESGYPSESSYPSKFQTSQDHQSPPQIRTVDPDSPSAPASRQPNASRRKDLLRLA